VAVTGQAAWILVVDDNAITRELVRVTLSSAGYAVVEAGDGATAYELLRHELPDLVLQGLALPDVSGFRLLQQIRELPGGADLPVLAFTGFLPRDDEARAEAAGFTEVLVKPLEPSELLEMVSAYVPPMRGEDAQADGGKRVLVVENDPVQRRLVRLRLEQAGFVVETAADGEQALEVARRSRPDAILADVLMPRLDGFRLCRAVRQDPDLRAIPLVLQSHQYVDEANRALALRLGANAYLPRTLDPRAAARALTAAMAGPVVSVSDTEIEEPYSEYLDRLVLQLKRQAVRNGELVLRNAMHAAALAVLGATADALAHEHTIESILDDTLYRCIDAAGLSVGIFYRVNGDAFVAQTIVGYSAAAGSAVHTAFGHPDLLRRALALADPIPLPSDTPDKAATDFLAKAGFRAALLMPVSFGEERFGVLLFASNASEAMAREWVGFARVIGGQIGQAMALSRSFDHLRMSEERYRELYHSTPLPLWTFDLETHAILSANDAAVALYGYTQQELLALRAEDLRPPEEVERWRTYVRTLPLGLHAKGIWRHRKKDGTPIIVDVTTHSTTLNGRRVQVVVDNDVTERERVADELAEREERFRQVVENMQEVFFIADIEYKEMLYISPAYEEVWGRTRESLYAAPQSFLDPVPADDRERVLESIAWVRRGEFPSGEEFRVVRPDGTIRWVFARPVPIKNDRGEVYRIAGIALDITKRKQSEEVVRRLTLAVEQSPASVLITDTAGDIEYVNRKFTEVTGYQPAEVLGKNPRILQSGETPKETYRELWETVTAGGEWHGELHNKKKNGELFWEAASISAVRDAAGAVTHYLAVKEDITERKHAREALRDSELRYHTLVDASFDGILIIEGARLVEVNRGIADMLGYSVEEMQRIGLLDLIAPESRPLVTRLLEGTDEGIFELSALNKGGRPALLQMVVRRVTHAGRPALLAAVRDITAQRSLEAQYRQAQKMEAVGRLAGGVAHDFNNLLTVITSYSQLMLEDMAPGDTGREDLEEIRRAANSAAALTRQLLAFSRQQVLQPVVLDLNGIVSGAAKMLQRVIGEDVALVTVLAPDLQMVKADPGQIEQVLMNLAVNARDAMPTGGKLTIETSNVVLDTAYAAGHTMVPAGDYVLLAMSDTGVGMTEDTKARLFEPFFTTKEQGKGTGLGLATVYGIVKQSGGFVWVYSELGNGTTFKVYLPQVSVQAEAQRHRTTSTELPHGTETVLLAEDAAPVRAVAKLILERCGYTVFEAPNGKVALDVAAGHREGVDLLVTDVVMPEMSGRELADRLRELRPGIKVLFVSGYTDDAVIRHGILDPGNAYLQKPFTPEALALKVRDVLDHEAPPR
jgi:PAS domain S-box-containing protein